MHRLAVNIVHLNFSSKSVNQFSWLFFVFIPLLEYDHCLREVMEMSLKSKEEKATEVLFSLVGDRSERMKHRVEQMMDITRVPSCL